MYLLNCIVNGLNQITEHKFRSVLTLLGIALGVASLVAVSATVTGMERGMKEAVMAMGGIEKVLIREQGLPPHQWHLKGQSTGITLKDAYALESSAPLLKSVSPLMHWEYVDISHNGKQTMPSGFQGVWPAVLEMRAHELAHGRFISDLDAKYAHSVCVIGTGIRDALFGSPEEVGREIIPLGEHITIFDESFEIVGMFKHYERESTRLARERRKFSRSGDSKSRKSTASFSRSETFWRKNNVIYVPLNTMWLKLRPVWSQFPYPKLHSIAIKVADIDQLEAALQQARNVLMRSHNGLEDFSLESVTGRMLMDIKERAREARLSGGGLAGVSLLVGAIGIMNIMLASINDRIREIGVCKSVGATGFAVFVQILAEAFVLSVLGMLIGLVGSFAVVELLYWATAGQAAIGTAGTLPSTPANIPMITVESMVAAGGFSLGVGVVAGLYPAWKAARLNPIEALR